MAQPFTQDQREQIRGRLFESACRHAREDGLKKTSLEMLTDDAGIAKSSFYRFYESKEHLFLEVAAKWEEELLCRAAAALREGAPAGDKQRAAAMVFAAFGAIHDLGIARFLREDMPLLTAIYPQSHARAHYLASAETIFNALREAHIAFTVPDEIMLSVIRLMYLSILNIGEIGDTFFPALRELVYSACDRLVK